MDSLRLVDYLLGSVIVICALLWLIDMADKKKWGGK